MSVTPVEIIKRTKSGKPLTFAEIKYLIDGFVKSEIPEYQVSAWLMAVHFQGLNTEETAFLTQVMLHSGRVLDFSDLPACKVDKHSTGGVGDKTSLILAPIVACAGLYVPMISGRGLGHTGGTLDKLESIPGFNTQIELDAFEQILSKTGLGLIGQTKDICPADKKLYALRDVTGTVESIPLICASIMSKKLAEGIDALILDVKYGSGAFMKSLEDAENLARSLVGIGQHAKKKTTALLTSMEQPLGRFIGNSLEVEECVAILRGDSTLYGTHQNELHDTIELSLQLAAHMLWLGEASSSPEAGYQLAEKILKSGQAYEKFENLCHEQGGELSQLPKASHQHTVNAPKSGFLQSFDCEAIGMAGIVLGAGRKTFTDVIDPVAGFQLHRKIGEEVKAGEPIFTLYASSDKNFAEVAERLHLTYEISLQKPETPTLIKKRI